jgi:hypothetical protein
MKTQAIILTLIAASTACAQSNIDADHKFAWGENVGWTNWRDADEAFEGVIAETTHLSGFVWAENVGWINVGNGDGPYANNDHTDFGVNIDPDTGQLSGLAWGENIGWINFDGGAMADPPQPARYDVCERRFSGFVWGENVGWISLGGGEHFLALGPCAFGDGDCDGDIDLDDFKSFAEAVTGPGADEQCPAFDADADNDVDLLDFGALQSGFGDS